MLNANDLKAGVCFLYHDEPWRVLKFKHTHLGRKGASVRVKIKNLKTNKLLSVNFGSKESFQQVWVEKQKLKFLKKEGEKFLFFDPENEEKVTLDHSVLGEKEKFLEKEKEYDFLTHEEEFLSLDWPPSLVMVIKEADPGVKGNSATNLYKRAVATNGLELKVPLFINPGDQVRVDTRSGEYLERI